MRIVLGGVRGSTPVSHPDFIKFGGATTCVLADNGAGGQILIDAGSGLRTVEPLIAPPAPDLPLLMLFTHYHIDHLIGLPFFSPFYDPRQNVIFAAPPCGGTTPEAAVGRLMNRVFWPVRFHARHRFELLPAECGREPMRHGPFDVRWCPVHHANGCFAYRIDERASGASMVFATDVELGGSSAAERESLLRLCCEPGTLDLLIMEGHCEASAQPGWGHSAWQETVAFAREVGARQLCITHLAPEDDDATLAEREQRVRAAMPQACLGRQGMVIPWSKTTNSEPRTPNPVSRTLNPLFAERT